MNFMRTGFKIVWITILSENEIQQRILQLMIYYTTENRNLLLIFLTWIKLNFEMMNYWSIRSIKRTSIIIDFSKKLQVSIFLQPHPFQILQIFNRWFTWISTTICEMCMSSVYPKNSIFYWWGWRKYGYGWGNVRIK